MPTFTEKGLGKWVKCRNTAHEFAQLWDHLLLLAHWWKSGVVNIAPPLFLMAEVFIPVQAEEEEEEASSQPPVFPSV